MNNELLDMIKNDIVRLSLKSEEEINAYLLFKLDVYYDLSRKLIDLIKDLPRVLSEGSADEHERLMAEYLPGLLKNYGRIAKNFDDTDLKIAAHLKSGKLQKQLVRPGLSRRAIDKRIRNMKTLSGKKSTKELIEWLERNYMI
jgi:hypothetical protein